MEFDDLVLKVLNAHAIFSIRSFDGIYKHVSSALLELSNATLSSEIVGTNGRQGQFNMPSEFMTEFFDCDMPGNIKPFSQVWWYCDNTGLFRPYVSWSVSLPEQQLFLDSYIPHPADITRVLDRYLPKADKYVSGNGSIFSRAVISTVMSYTRGYTYAQIADNLNVSPKTVANRLDRFTKEAEFESTKELALYVSNAFRGPPPQYYPHNQSSLS